MFHSARIKLTAYYCMIIMCVSLAFSGVIYKALMSEVTRFERMQRFRIESRLEQGTILPFDQRLRPPGVTLEIDPILLEETRGRILLTLIIINAGILVLSGGLGYILAGRTLKPIKEMVDEQNRFISDASHELKTPLTSLKSAFEVYLRGKQTDLKEAKTLVQESLTEVNRLQSLSESLLQLTQYQKPSGQHKFVQLEVANILKESIKNTTMLAKQKQIFVKSDLDDLKIMGIRDSLVELFVIILDNAIKYSPDKSEINVIVRKVDGFVHIGITDQGVGIDEKDLSFIFERFYRADSVRSRGGYGLGLAIAKRIVEIHKGMISVKSEPGKGSEFIVKIPLFSGRFQN